MLTNKDASNDTIHEYPWAVGNDILIKDLNTDSANGLTNEEIIERQKKFGKNAIKNKKTNNWRRILYRQFQNPLIFILLIAVLVTLALADYLDAFIIALAILVNTGLGFYQETKAQRAVANLQSFITVRTRVVRAGQEQEIDANDIVPGDIIHLTLGSRVPADGRVLSTQGLAVDEAILTGESLPVAKTTTPIEAGTILSERINMVYGGTLVTEGSALVLILATGQRTEFGKIAQLVGATNQEATPLQKIIHKLAWFIAGVVTILVSGVFLLGVIRGEGIYEMFLVSVAVAVGTIPEALPIGLTAVLAVGVQRLAKRQGIMRNLTAAETLGSTTVVITDKTGTLTEAKLDLVAIHTYLELLTSTTAEIPTQKVNLSLEHKDILQIARLATDVIIENKDDRPEDWRMAGSPLETTLVRSAGQHGLTVMNREQATFVLPFNSRYKFSVTASALKLCSLLAGKKNINAYIILGAPDILLTKAKLTKDDYLKLQTRLDQESHTGKRLLGVAIMRLPKGNISQPPVTPEEITDIDFLGVLAFVDPIRKEVPAAIKKIEQFGVRVIMATGDLAGTAVAVASQLGWEVLPHEIVTGDMLASLTDEELTSLLVQVKIFARVTPADKLRIAKALQAKGEVVAMTGDGVNDTPSLKAVDIGIAVGSGSDVAKEVADLILLDDNFNTIVSAVEEGKRVMRNIRKTFVYLMSNSLDEIFLIGGSLLAGIALPLSAIQIIWVNFFTGSIPAIAFAFDNENITYNKQTKPEKIIDRAVKYITLLVGVGTSIALFLLYWWLTKTNYNPAEIKTFIFVCFATYILLVAFSLRSLSLPIWRYNPFNNQVLNFGVVGGLILTLATIYIPSWQNIFSTVALSLWWWGWVSIWLILAVVLIESVKLFIRKIK